MDFRSFVLVVFVLILIEGCVAITLTHGVYGKYFKSSANIGEGMKKLRVEKPTASNVVASCYLLMLIEVFSLLAYKLWG